MDDGSMAEILIVQELIARRQTLSSPSTAKLPAGRLRIFGITWASLATSERGSRHLLDEAQTLTVNQRAGCPCKQALQNEIACGKLYRQYPKGASSEKLPRAENLMN
jgi:hypothetical protein